MFARVWEKPMAAAPKISVIIPHYNDVRGLAICLDKLADQTVAKDAFEIIVADNDSPQGEEAIRQLIGGRATLVVVRERGAGPARFSPSSIPTARPSRSGWPKAWRPSRRAISLAVG
jgi:hypothetical protein